MIQTNQSWKRKLVIQAKKIPDTNNLVKKNRKEIESKIPSITGLATTSALTAVENKIPNVSTLVK